MEVIALKLFCEPPVIIIFLVELLPPEALTIEITSALISSISEAEI